MMVALVNPVHFTYPPESWKRAPTCAVTKKDDEAVRVPAAPMAVADGVMVIAVEFVFRNGPER